jgi:hypothetical protein
MPAVALQELISGLGHTVTSAPRSQSEPRLASIGVQTLTARLV